MQNNPKQSIDRSDAQTQYFSWDVQTDEQNYINTSNQIKRNPNEDSQKNQDKNKKAITKQSFFNQFFSLNQYQNINRSHKQNQLNVNNVVNHQDNDLQKIEQINQKLSEQHQKQKLSQVVHPKLSWINPQPDTFQQQPQFTLPSNQRLITQYCSNQTSRQLFKNNIQLNQQQQQYKIVINPAKQQFQNNDINSSLSVKGSQQKFYKNNDIYGVQDDIVKQKQDKQDKLVNQYYNDIINNYQKQQYNQSKWQIQQNQYQKTKSQQINDYPTYQKQLNQKQFRQRNSSMIAQYGSKIYSNSQINQNQLQKTINNKQITFTLTVNQLDENKLILQTQNDKLYQNQIKNQAQKQNKQYKKDQQQIKIIRRQYITEPHEYQEQQLQLEILQKRSPKQLMISRLDQSIKQNEQTKLNIDSNHPTRITTVKQKHKNQKISLKKAQKKQIGSKPRSIKISKNKQYNNKQEQQQQQQKLLPFGSMYHYSLIDSKRSGKKSLVPVRRSSRIFEKSKSKHKLSLLSDLDQNGLKQQTQINQASMNTITNNNSKKSDISKNKPKQKQSKNLRSKSKTIHSKSKQSKPLHSKSKSKLLHSKSKSKPSILSKSQHRSKQKPRQQIFEQIDVDWLKQHLNQINIDNDINVYMYQDYKAMTQKDKEITQLLMEIEGKNSKSMNKTNKYSQKQQNQHLSIRMQRNVKKQQQSNKINPDNKKSVKKDKQNKSKSKKTKKQQQKSQQKQQQQNDLNNENKDNNDYQQYGQQINFSENINQSYLQPQLDLPGPLNHIQRFNLIKHKYRLPQSFPLTIQNVITPDISSKGIYALVQLGRLSQFQLGTKYAITPITTIKHAKRKDIVTVLEQSKELVPDEYRENIAYVPLNSNIKNLIQQEEKRRERIRNNEEKEYQI